jgi:hypothetical protein
MYFPVVGHLEAWHAGKDYLVAYDPGIDEQKVKQIKSFDIRNQEINLSSYEPPQNPTMVIAQDEHWTLKKVPVKAFPTRPIEANKTSNPKMKNIRQICIRINENMKSRIEPWYRGSAELYAWIVSKGGPGNLKNMFFYPSIKDEITFYGCNEGHVLFEWKVPHYDKFISWHFWESDGGESSLPISVIVKRVEVKVEIKYGDEDAGQFTVNLDDLTYPLYRDYSTGIITLVLDMDS